MNRPKTKSVTEEIFESMNNRAVEGGDRLSESSPEFSAIYGELDRYQKEDVVVASSGKSTLFALTGNLDKALYWAKNAATNGGRDAGLHSTFLAYLLCGRPKEAYELVDQVFANLGDMPFHYFLRHTMATGWFEKAEHYLDVCRKNNRVHKGIDGIEIVSPAASVLKANGVSAETVNAIMECAHKIMAHEQTIWHGNLPIITVHEPDSEMGFVMMRFILQRTPEEAAELSWQLAEELANRNLDVPGLVVGFSPKTAAATREAVAA